MPLDALNKKCYAVVFPRYTNAPHYTNDSTRKKYGYVLHVYRFEISISCCRWLNTVATIAMETKYQNHEDCCMFNAAVRQGVVAYGQINSSSTASACQKTAAVLLVGTEFSCA
ncbi:hypothetical protein D1007_33422 [Hordeum vulgare]|nr:hypothetical protein D1007_33422 [Hordeum vulgare]